jgi:capsular polysaccharide transport system permease protein
VLFLGAESEDPPESPHDPVRMTLSSEQMPTRYGATRTITALVLREMGSTYGKSPGGYVWAILQPLGMIGILTVMFSLIVRTPPLGTSFILFYATGYLPFHLYSVVARKTATSLRYSRALLAYPSVTWLDAILARLILTAITEITVMCIVMGAILMTVEMRTVIDILPMVLAVTLAILIGLGVGMINCLLGGLFPVWNIFWGITSRPLVIASGVLFLYRDMPPFVQDIVWWNPLLHATGLARSGFYPTYDTSYVSIAYTLGVALVMIALGLVFLRAYFKSVLEQ